MSEMVEKVARAIQTAAEQYGGAPYDYAIRNKHSREALFARARAAIAAMREPTEAMIKVGFDAIADPEECSLAWKAMIDEALK